MKTTKARKYNSKILEKIFADIPKSLDKQVSSTMIIAALIDDEMKKTILGWLDKEFPIRQTRLPDFDGYGPDKKTAATDVERPAVPDEPP